MSNLNHLAGFLWGFRIRFRVEGLPKIRDTFKGDVWGLYRDIEGLGFPKIRGTLVGVI